MNSSKTLKLFVFALFLIILVSAFAVASGAGEQVVPKIVGKNIFYNDKTAIQFAVSPVGIDKNDVRLIVTKADGIEKTISEYKESTVSVNGISGALVFTIEGVPASAVCDNVTVVVKSGDRESEPLSYSVAEYFFERLYSDGIINASSDDALATRQKSLYLNYLAYAESSQELFKNYYGEQNITLVSEYSYIGGSHAVLANKTDSMLSANSFETTVTADETLSGDKRFLDKWTVTAYGEEITAKVIDDGDKITVSGQMSLSPVYSDAKGEYFLSSEAGGRYDYDKITQISSSTTSYIGKTGRFEIADGSLRFEDGDAENQAMIAKYEQAYPSSYNVTVFEFDFMLNDAGSSYPLQIKIANQTYTIYCSNGYNASYGTGHKLCMKVGGAYIPLGTPIGEWSTIRFEHYYDNTTLKVFVNNRFVYDIFTNKGSEAAPMIYLTSYERGTDTNADLYIDNVYVGHLTKTFVKGDPAAAEK